MDGRPKEFELVLQACVATMAGLQNNCGVAYAMLKTGGFVDVSEGRSKRELSTLERQFRESAKEYDSLTTEQQTNWSEQTKRKHPSLIDVATSSLC